jgi:DNA-binding MarR family transcriptional regulator
MDRDMNTTRKASSLAASPRSGERESIPVGRLIHDVARLHRKVFDNEMQSAGLTRSQWSVLSCLARQQGESLTQTEIARALEIGKVTLGGLIDRLEAKGFVRREFTLDDRRVKQVRLTTKGLRASGTTTIVRPIVDDLVMRGLSPLARRKVVEALASMRANLLQMHRGRREALPSVARRLRAGPRGAV